MLSGYKKTKARRSCSEERTDLQRKVRQVAIIRYSAWGTYWLTNLSCSPFTDPWAHNGFQGVFGATQSANVRYLSVRGSRDRINPMNDDECFDLNLISNLHLEIWFPVAGFQYTDSLLAGISWWVWPSWSSLCKTCHRCMCRAHCRQGPQPMSRWYSKVGCDMAFDFLFLHGWYWLPLRPPSQLEQPSSWFCEMSGDHMLEVDAGPWGPEHINIDHLGACVMCVYPKLLFYCPALSCRIDDIAWSAYLVA